MPEETETSNVYDMTTGERISEKRFDILEDYRLIDLDAEEVLRFVVADPSTARARAKRLAPLVRHLRSVMQDAEIGPWLTWRQEFLRDRSPLEIAHTAKGLDYLEVIVPLVEADRPSAKVVALVR